MTEHTRTKQPALSEEEIRKALCTNNVEVIQDLFKLVLSLQSGETDRGRALDGKGASLFSLVGILISVGFIALTSLAGKSSCCISRTRETVCCLPPSVNGRFFDHRPLEENKIVKFRASILTQELSTLAGVPIFLSGPHANSFELKNIQSFGHYNPAFLEWAKRIAIPRDGEYFRLTSPIFEKFLSQHLGSLLQARYYLHANTKRFQEILSKYKSALQSKKIFAHGSNSLWRKATGGLSYLAFWIRRQIDGTSQIVQELLELAMEACFPSGLQHLRRQLRASPYAITMLGSYHGEEVKFENGEKAFGLYIDDGRSVLKSHIVDIDRVHDAIADNKGQKTGKLVNSQRREKSPRNWWYGGKG